MRERALSSCLRHTVCVVCIACRLILFFFTKTAKTKHFSFFFCHTGRMPPHQRSFNILAVSSLLFSALIAACLSLLASRCCVSAGTARCVLDTRPGYYVDLNGLARNGDPTDYNKGVYWDKNDYSEMDYLVNICSPIRNLPNKRCQLPSSVQPPIAYAIQQKMNTSTHHEGECYTLSGGNSSDIVMQPLETGVSLWITGGQPMQDGTPRATHLSLYCSSSETEFHYWKEREDSGFFVYYFYVYSPAACEKAWPQ